MLSDSTGQDIAIEIVLNHEIDGKFGSFPKDDVINIRNEIEKFKLQNKLIETYTVGTPIFTSFLYEGIKQTNILNIALIFIILISCKILFGRWGNGFWLCLSFIMTGVIVYGLMSFFNKPLEILSSSLFLLIVISSLEDFFFVAMRQSQTNENFNQCLYKTLVPSFFTSFTTVIGFASLCFSNVDIISRLGLWAAIGAIIEWMMIFMFLPALFKIFKIDQIATKPLLPLSKIKLKVNYIRLPRYISKVLLLSFLFCGYALVNLVVEDSPLALLPKDHIFQKDFQYIETSRGWKGTLNIVFQNQVSKNKINQIKKEVLNLENSIKIESPHDYTDFFNNQLNSDLNKIIESDFKFSAGGKRFYSVHEKSRLIVYFKHVDYKNISDYVNMINKICASDCKPIGELVSYAEFTSRVPEALVRSFGMSLVMVALSIYILMYIFKLPNKLSFILGILWGPTIVISIIYLLKIELNFMSSIFATLLIGLAGDNGVHFIFSSINQNIKTGIEESSIAALSITGLMCLACSLFLFSYFAPPKVFGLIMVAGFICSYIGDVIITKSFIEK